MIKKKKIKSEEKKSNKSARTFTKGDLPSADLTESNIMEVIKECFWCGKIANF